MGAAQLITDPENPAGDHDIVARRARGIDGSLDRDRAVAQSIGIPPELLWRAINHP
jgi:hypothetical protein